MIYKCPYTDCDGQLEYVIGESTTMGFFAFDNNRVRETFVCNKCGRKVLRAFKWVQEEKDEYEEYKAGFNDAMKAVLGEHSKNWEIK